MLARAATILCFVSCFRAKKTVQTNVPISGNKTRRIVTKIFPKRKDDLSIHKSSKTILQNAETPPSEKKINAEAQSA